ncbi:hypothetical protein BDW59DRAFT_153633 [Aspergillus cavernicola]|uniref:Nephrocystin 3-like N-terminal domain-containing protein n=1 Tax=Aspergillus cavernicola TaxID=176166 RepID=A0ABR4HM56_9EURO
MGTDCFLPRRYLEAQSLAEPCRIRGSHHLNAETSTSPNFITPSPTSPSPYAPRTPLLSTLELTQDLEDREKAFARRVRSSLQFRGMDDRATRIKLAFPNTFQWLFEEDIDSETEEEQPEPSFRTWLTSQDKTIFWITGVPASGKSTLMKFIAEHPQWKTG